MVHPTRGGVRQGTMVHGSHARTRERLGRSAAPLPARRAALAGGALTALPADVAEDANRADAGMWRQRLAAKGACWLQRRLRGHGAGRVQPFFRCSSDLGSTRHKRPQVDPETTWDRLRFGSASTPRPPRSGPEVIPGRPHADHEWTPSRHHHRTRIDPETTPKRPRNDPETTHSQPCLGRESVPNRTPNRPRTDPPGGTPDGSRTDPASTSSRPRIDCQSPRLDPQHRPRTDPNIDPESPPTSTRPTWALHSVPFAHLAPYPFGPVPLWPRTYF